MAQSLRALPVSLFGAAMGTGGLGLACRAATEVLGLAAWWSIVFVAIGAATLGVLLVAYALKWVVHSDAARAELAHPAQLGFAATLPLALCIVAGGLGPFAGPLAHGLWWAGYALLCVVIVGTLARLVAGGIELAHLNTGWMLALVSGVVIPVAGVPLGYADASRILYGVGILFAPLVIGVVFYRMIVAPPLPPGLRPTWAIFVVPPAMIYLNYSALTLLPAGFFVDAAYAMAWVFALAISIASRDCPGWPFTPAWWALTFPADALAGAAIRYASAHPGPLSRALAWIALAVAILVVILVLVRTFVALARGILLVGPPASSPSGASPTR